MQENILVVGNTKSILGVLGHLVPNLLSNIILQEYSYLYHTWEFFCDFEIVSKN